MLDPSGRHWIVAAWGIGLVVSLVVVLGLLIASQCARRSSKRRYVYRKRAFVSFAVAGVALSTTIPIVMAAANS